MAEESSSTERVPHAWLLLPWSFAAACVLASIAVTGPRWAQVFQSQLRTDLNGGAIVDATLAGAGLWRAMLAVSGAALLVVPLLLVWSCPRSARLPGLAATTAGRGAPSGLRRAALILVGLVALATLLRAVRIRESLWYDELSVLFDYLLYGPGAVVGNYFVSSNHIAHTLLTWCSITLLGVDEISLRLPAALFSIATVPAAAGLARRAGLGETAALVAAALIAVMPVSVLEGVEARGYSMMMFFAAGSTWALLAAWEDDRPWLWCLFALLAALGVWSHLMTVFLVVGHGTWVIARGAAERRMGRALRGMAGLALSAVLTATLYAPVVPDILAIRSDFRSLDGDEPGIFGTEGLHAILQLGGSWYAWAALPGLLLLALGTASAARDPRLRWALGAAWLGIPISIVILLAVDSWIYARFLLFAIPGAAIAIAAGLDAVARRNRPAMLVSGLLLAACFAADLMVRPPKQPLRDAAGFVADRRSPDDRAGSIGLFYPVVDYYARDLQIDLRASGPYGAGLEQMLDLHQPRWVIVSYPRSIPEDRFAMLERAGFEEVARFRGWVDWNNGDVVVYGKKGTGAFSGVRRR